MIRAMLAASLAVLLAAAPSRAQSTVPDETQPSEAGALATTDHWGQAEAHGDTTFIDQLLLPEYRSVDAGGVVHAKAAILASTRRHAGAASASAIAARAEYAAAHPHGTLVELRDQTAVVTYYSSALGPELGVMSSDILVYRDGRWHALYSQHADFKTR